MTPPTFRPARPDRVPLALALLAGLLAGWPASTAAAQEGGAAADAPPDEIDQAEHVMPRVRPESTPIRPTASPEVRTPQPGLTGGAEWGQEPGSEQDAAPLDTGPLRLPEGASIVKRPGRVLTAPSGHRVFVIDAQHRQPGEVPMLLLPCRTLARLDTSLAGSAESTVVVSGFVYEYAQRNYLLPTAFGRVSEAEIAEALGAPDQGQTPPEAPARPTRASADQASMADDPDVAELMAELSQSPGLRAIAPPPTLETPAQTDPPPSGDRAASDGGFVPDGTPITRRRCRLVRLSGGEWAVRFDNDMDTAAGSPGAGADEPLTVLPCRLLERTESLAMNQGDGLELLVSGRVYTYGARRYILPTIFQRPLKIGIDPLQ